ncbi:MAG: type IV toxin-antitoxin system AbiEi family antitoxin domain-containing protein [Candidatus Dormibacteraceae bacterium]
MSWLVDHGPVAAKPPLPMWALDRLVRQGRVMRLRRDFYLAPTKEGQLPSIQTVAGLLSPGGYISFHGAFILHGLTDQDTSTWVVMSERRQAAARYGTRRIQFVYAPARAAAGHTQVRNFDGFPVRVATVAQAMFDCLARPQSAPSPRALISIFALGLKSVRLNKKQFIQLVVEADSPAVARRAGLLLELAGAKVDERVRNIALRTHDRSPLLRQGPAAASDPTWRLELPVPREELVAAAREL